jgi:acylpyruvate hydrolase
MRLVSYELSGSVRLGVQAGEWLIDIIRGQQHVGSEYLRPWRAVHVGNALPGEIIPFLSAGQPALDAASELVDLVLNQLRSDRERLREKKVLLLLEEVVFKPAVTNPGKILCVGMNYPLPGQEGGKPEFPVIFLKLASTLNGHRQPVILPAVSQEVVFEGELAVVIGKSGKHIPRDQAMEYVAGFTIANDLTASDLERRSSQWATGKLPETFTPLGPALVTRDELPDPGGLVINTYCNNALVQRGKVDDMFFDVSELVSYLSTIIRLEIGDLLLTGSPKEINGAPAPKIFLSPGDKLMVEIDSLGNLCNPVTVQEQNDG